MTTEWLKADVWSLGCTVVEMVSGNLPFSYYDNPMTAMYHIACGEAPSFRNLPVSDSLKAFVIACCAAEPTARPTAQELMRYDFVAPLTAKYLNDPELEGCAQKDASTEPLFNTIDGVVISIDMFCALDDSLGSHYDDKTANETMTSPKLFTTACLGDSLLISRTNSETTSPPKMRKSITEDSMDTTDATINVQQQQKTHRISNPGPYSSPGPIINASKSSSRSKPAKKYPPSQSVIQESTHSVRVSKGTSRYIGMSRSNSVEGGSSSSTGTSKDQGMSSSPSAQSTSATSKAGSGKSSRGSVSSSPMSTARQLPPTFPALIVQDKGVSTSASTPSNLYRRAPSHNGPLVAKPPQVDTYFKLKERGKEKEKEKDRREITREILDIRSAIIKSQSSRSPTSAITSAIIPGTQCSVSCLHSLADIEASADGSSKSPDDNQNTSHDNVTFAGSDVFKNIDITTIPRLGSIDCEDLTGYASGTRENFTEKVILRLHSKGSVTSHTGRPPAAQPQSPSMYSLSPIPLQPLYKNCAEQRDDKELRRASSLTYEDFKIIEGSPSQRSQKLAKIPMPLSVALEFGPTEGRRERSNSDSTVPVNISYSRGYISDHSNREEEAAAIVGGLNSGIRSNAPTSGEVILRGDIDPLTISNPTGLYDTFPSVLPEANKSQHRYLGFSASCDSVSRSNRLDSGSERINRLTSPGAASVRAHALKESEELSCQQEGRRQWGGVPSLRGPSSGGYGSSKSNRKAAIKKSARPVSYDNNTDRSIFSGSSGRSILEPTSFYERSSSLRSQSAGLLNVVHRVGGDIDQDSQRRQDSTSYSQLEPLRSLEASRTGPTGSSAVRNSNCTPGILGRYPLNLGVNITEHLLPAMNMMLPLQRRLMQSAPSLSRYAGGDLTVKAGSLPSLRSCPGSTTTIPTRSCSNATRLESTYLYNSNNNNTDGKATNRVPDSNSLIMKGNGKFPKGNVLKNLTKANPYLPHKN
jgi:Protein kinase domain